MNEPRPAMISARPPEIRSSSANCLKDAYGVLRAEDGHGAREPDPLGPGGDRRQHDGRCGDEKVRPVVLADREHVEADLIGQLGLLEQLAHALLRRYAGGEVGEGGESEFHIGSRIAGSCLRNYLLRGLLRPGPGPGNSVTHSPAGPENVTLYRRAMPSQFGPLITPDELAELIEQDPPAILDVRWEVATGADRAAYLKGHVPGAVFVDLDRQLSDPPSDRGRHPLPDPDRFGTDMRGLGVSQDRHVRPLRRRELDGRRAGLVAISLLRPSRRGGPGRRRQAWREGGWPLEHRRARPGAGRLRSPPGRDAHHRGRGGGERFTDRGVLLDARARERFLGLIEPIDPVAGHIPGARNRPTTENVDAGGRFCSAGSSALPSQSRRAGGPARRGVLRVGHHGRARGTGPRAGRPPRRALSRLLERVGERPAPGGGTLPRGGATRVVHPSAWAKPWRQLGHRGAHMSSRLSRALEAPRWWAAASARKRLVARRASQRGAWRGGLAPSAFA